MPKEQREELIRKGHRWFTSIATALCTGLLLWGLQTLSAVDRTQAVIVARLDTIEATVSGSYSVKDARRDFSAVADRFSATGHRMDILENRLDAYLIGRKPVASAPAMPSPRASTAAVLP